MNRGEAMERLDEARRLLGEVYVEMHDVQVEVACFGARIEIDAARLSLTHGLSYSEARGQAARVRQVGEEATA